MFKRKIIYVLLLAVIILLPFFSLQAQTADEVFRAKVVKILETKDLLREDGSKALQQNLLLRGVEGEWKDKEVEYQGISEIDVVSANTFKVGDKVIVQKSVDEEDQAIYTIIDFDRQSQLFWLAVIFCLTILIIGKKKGFRALLALLVSFVLLIEFILPKILAGANPLLWGAIGSFLILLFIIYLTEGWNRKSHLAIVCVFFSLIVILFLSWLFTGMTKLTGLVNEESMFLIGMTQSALDFKGLLLASILIGAVGVLDDVIVGQIEAVLQIKEANPNLTSGQVFKASYKVGNTHLGAIVNTLFLTYAGASLPLLLLFSVHQEPFLTFWQVINNEAIATEIVRTLVGSIGIALSMPIATFLATYFIKVEK